MQNIKLFTVVLLVTILVPNTFQLDVECGYQPSTGFKVVGKKSGEEEPYACIARTLNIRGKTVLSGATGQHEAGHTNVNVKCFYIYGGICEIIPSGVGSIYPNIEALTVWNSTLKTVSSEDLQQFPNLREIWLYDNQLEFVPSNLFQFNAKVQYINFKNNAIKYIGGNFFNVLSHLKGAEFWSNVCIDDAAADASQLEAIKMKIKEKCSLPGTTGGLIGTDYGVTGATGGIIGTDYGVSGTTGGIIGTAHGLTGATGGLSGTFSSSGTFTSIQDVETLYFIIALLRNDVFALQKGNVCGK